MVATEPDDTKASHQIALGQRLFNEPSLSRDGVTTCATCHNPKHAFTDNRVRARGNDGNPLDRNTPTLFDLKDAKNYTWDGRSTSLEDQAQIPIEHPREMNMKLDEAVARLRQQREYQDVFDRAFDERPALTARNVLTSIAAYERTLSSPITRFDQWVAGNDKALARHELEGLSIFVGRARCIGCHGGWRFTDGRFHDVGLPSQDLGRAAIPGTNAAPHTFKTPTLRQLAHTAPYMHDGSIPSLDAVINHYARKRVLRPSLADELKRPLSLSPAEEKNLIAFLKTLSSAR